MSDEMQYKQVTRMSYSELRNMIAVDCEYPTFGEFIYAMNFGYIYRGRDDSVILVDQNGDLRDFVLMLEDED